jgi:hypothetical protein
MNIEEAKALEVGQVIYDNILRNADGTPMKWKVIGKPKTWKGQPNRVQVSLKRSLFQYDLMTENSLSEFSLTEKEALSGAITRNKNMWSR